jgi:GNAT superfamily N-acetyltransferase
MNIREACEEDADALTEIAFAAKRHWRYPENWVRQWQEALTITPEYISKNPTFVAAVEDEIVGFGAVQIEGGDAVLDHLWVLPQFMGRGLGRALFQHAEEIGRASGAVRMRIVGDPHAEQFYFHMGAIVYGESRRAWMERRGSSHCSRSRYEPQTAQQGARANDHGCHDPCSEQHGSRQPRSWLILNVRQKTSRFVTSDYLKRLGAQGHLKVKEVLRKWDPIGVYGPGGDGPDDEYDAYSAPVVAMLDHGASKGEIVSYLEKVCVEHIEVGFDRKHTEALVDELLTFWSGWKQRVREFGEFGANHIDE